MALYLLASIKRQNGNELCNVQVYTYMSVSDMYVSV